MFASLTVVALNVDCPVRDCLLQHHQDLAVGWDLGKLAFQDCCGHGALIEGCIGQLRLLETDLRDGIDNPPNLCRHRECPILHPRLSCVPENLLLIFDRDGEAFAPNQAGFDLGHEIAGILQEHLGILIACVAERLNPVVQRPSKLMVEMDACAIGNVPCGLQGRGWLRIVNALEERRRDVLRAVCRSDT